MHMKSIYTGIAAVLLLFAMLFTASCAVLSAPSDEEMRREIAELLPRSYEATDLIYGAGAPIEEDFEIDPNWKFSHYAPVAATGIYKSEEDIKLLVESVFTKDYAEEMYEYAFKGNDDLMSRYNTSEGKLYIDVTKEPLGMATDIYAETAKVVSGSAYACLVEIEYSMNGGQTREKMTVRMVKTDDKWYFDGPTY